MSYESSAMEWANAPYRLYVILRGPQPADSRVAHPPREPKN